MNFFKWDNEHCMLIFKHLLVTFKKENDGTPIYNFNHCRARNWNIDR